MQGPLCGYSSELQLPVWLLAWPLYPTTGSLELQMALEGQAHWCTIPSLGCGRLKAGSGDTMSSGTQSTGLCQTPRAEPHGQQVASVHRMDPVKQLCHSQGQ